MQIIDEQRLESDVNYRFEYTSGFMGFTGDDVQAIHNAAPHLAPLVPAMVDAVYNQLFSFDATKRHFVPRQSGYEGEVPTNIEELTQDHEMIQFRKQHLAGYFTNLVTRAYNEKLVVYLDTVGRIHTPQAGNADLDVPLVQMNALMGFVADALLSAICDLGLDDATQTRTLRAFNKLLWLQNDLIVRHYAAAR